MIKYHFFNNCVGWNPDDVEVPGGLHDLINDRESITYRTFLSKVVTEDAHEMFRNLGYEINPRRGLTIKDDFAVEFFKSKHHGELVYGFRWSGVEYVYKRGTIL